MGWLSSLLLSYTVDVSRAPELLFVNLLELFTHFPTYFIIIQMFSPHIIVPLNELVLTYLALQLHC